MENYGDIHLHHSDYPDYPGTYTYDGKCRYSPYDHDKFDKYETPSPCGAGVDSCHVEYCHPGSWQGKQEPQCDGMVKNYCPSSQQVDCNQGVFGGEPTGNYDKHDKHETQSGAAFAHGPGCGCPACSVAGNGSLFSNWTTLMWLFVLIVAFIVGRRMWNRLA